jgi:hypothetical protein
MSVFYHGFLAVNTMEAIVAVLRPRHPVTAMSADLRLESYDILLVEMRMLTARDKVRTMKQLPATNILLDDEPGDALIAFLYRFTGADNGGITGILCCCYVFYLQGQEQCIIKD